MASHKTGLTKSKIRAITTAVDNDIRELETNLASLSKLIEEMQTQKIWVGGKRSAAWYSNMSQNIVNSRKINDRVDTLNGYMRGTVISAEESW